MAANENSVVNGASITPPRNGIVTSVVPPRAGSSPFHSIGNNEVSDESLNLLKSRFADSSNAKKSNIASLERVFFAMKDTADKVHETVVKANDKEDEKDDLLVQLITGNTPAGAPFGAAPTNGGWTFRANASTSTNVPAYAKPSTAPVPWAFPPAGAPTNGGFTVGATGSFGANASTSTNVFDNVKLAPSTWPITFQISCTLC